MSISSWTVLNSKPPKSLGWGIESEESVCRSTNIV